MTIPPLSMPPRDLRRRGASFLGSAMLLALSAGSAAADTPYVGEVSLLASQFCPLGYLVADGAALSTAEYETLFFLLGTTYGGDGETTFRLPNLMIAPEATTGASGPIRLSRDLLPCIATEGIYPAP